MIELIEEELKKHNGKKCIISLGLSQFRILYLMTNDVSYNHDRECQTFLGHKIERLKIKSFLKIVPE